MKGDYEILARLRLKEQAALEMAIHQYAGYVAAVINKTLGSLGTPQDVEELSSDAFVALWQNAEKLRDNSDLKYWLAVVARNAALKRRQKMRFEEPLEDNFIADAPVEDPWEREERTKIVRRAVDGLEPVDKEVFLRHYFWHQTVVQIAGEMGKKPSAIKSRLARGREKLKKVLMKEDCLL